MRNLTEYERNYVLKKINGVRKNKAILSYLLSFLFFCSIPVFVLLYPIMDFRSIFYMVLAIVGTGVTAYGVIWNRKAVANKENVNKAHVETIRGEPISDPEETGIGESYHFIVDGRAVILPPGWKDVLFANEELELEVAGANGELGHVEGKPYAIALRVRGKKGELSISDSWFKTQSFYSYSRELFVSLLSLVFAPIVSFFLLLNQLDSIGQIRYAYSQPVELNNINEVYTRIHNGTIKENVYITNQLYRVKPGPEPNGFKVGSAKELYSEDELFKGFKSGFDEYFKNRVDALEATPKKKTEILEFILTDRPLRELSSLGLSLSLADLANPRGGKMKLITDVKSLIMERQQFKHAVSYVPELEKFVDKAVLVEQPERQSKTRLFIYEKQFSSHDDVYQFRITNGVGVFTPIDIDQIKLYLNIFLGFLGGWFMLLVMWRYQSIRDNKRFNFLEQKFNKV